MRFVCIFLALSLWLAPSATAQAGRGDSARAIQIRNPCGISLSPSPPLWVLDGDVVEFGPGRRYGFSSILGSDDVLDIRALKADEATRRYGAASRNGVVEVATRSRPFHPAPGAASGAILRRDSGGAGAPMVLRVDLSGPVRAEVLDALGCRVFAVTREPGASALSLPMTRLLPGAYVVRVSGAGGVVSRTVTVH